MHEAKRPLRVLMVDDDTSQLDMTSRMLRLEGFEVKTVSESLGVSVIAREFAPDVVLLDVEIPALSGDRLLSVLRENLRGASTALVLFSACDVDTLRRLATDVGADAWIRKGLEPEELAARLRRLCLQ
ncbi:MAG: response regulator [Myxococcota bacterium]